MCIGMRKLDNLTSKPAALGDKNIIRNIQIRIQCKRYKNRRRAFKWIRSTKQAINRATVGTA